MNQLGLTHLDPITENRGGLAGANILSCEESTSRVGASSDTAVAESFFSYRKMKMCHQQNFENYLAAKTAVMEYSESRYNRRRTHAYNEGLQPAAVLVVHNDCHQHGGGLEARLTRSPQNLDGRNLHTPEQVAITDNALLPR